MTEIHVRNISYSATEADLKSLIETWFGPGSVVSCEIKRDPHDFQHKGYGFVTMLDNDKADILLCLVEDKDHEFVLDKRQLRFEVSNRLENDPNRRGGKTQSAGKQVEAAGLTMGFLVHSELHGLWASQGAVEIDYDVLNRKFSFIVNVLRNSRLRQFKLEFLFKYIFQVSSAVTNGGVNILLVEVFNPPRVYKRLDEVNKWKQDSGLDGLTDLLEGLMPIQEKLDSSQGRWVRTTDFTPSCSIGHSLAYVVDFPRNQGGVLSALLRDLKPQLTVNTVSKRLTFAMNNTTLPSQPLVPLLTPPPKYKLDFKLMFKLNHLVQVGSLKSPLLSNEFYELLSRTPTELSLWAMQELLNSDDTIDDAVKWFKDELKRYDIETRSFPSSPLIALDEGLIWVYRLLITPTKVYCIGPEVEISNRVTRQYKQSLDNFIRVSFVEEDWEALPPAGACLISLGGLLSNFKLGLSDIHDRIFEILNNGFVLGGKKYEFLAFSSSQLREQSIWMFAADNQTTAQSIRSWMGDFLKIRNVAKCAARMGQCFSSSTRTLVVYPEEMESIDDIMVNNGTNEFCFSDGIGQISRTFASTVAARCDCKRVGSRRVPSAFQIRYAGYKGVVAVNPQSNYKLSLRPSMKKFESSHYYLEVIGWTKPLPCYLNRQIITLLSTLGVQDHVFEQMQSSIVSKLHQLMTDRRAAIEFLQAISLGASHAVSLAMLKSGYEPQSEPYLMGLLQAFRASQFARVQNKARILVPKGRCLMGCLDETGSLVSGEVFVQVSNHMGRPDFMDDGLGDYSNLSTQDSQSTGTSVLTCPMVVAKNPCLHPGDVRVLRGVDIPELRHMVDCIVFPQRGDRPHPNECSGSDLDGDLYFVTWDPLLTPPTTDDPMDYTAAKEIELDRNVTIQDIQEFFIQYMINDSLGVIANAHTVLADKEDSMARNQKCLELARLFSVAVDFPKTGKAAVITRDLRPQKYPDFMGKDKKDTYQSSKVLGKLYRALSEVNVTRGSKTFYTKNLIANSFDEDLILDGGDYKTYLSEAWNLKKCYDMKLLNLMEQYSIKTEIEVVSGHICSKSWYFVRHQSEVRVRIRQAMDSLQKEARSWFNSGYESSEGYQIDESIELTEWEKMVKASAWYYVSYHRSYVFREGLSKNSENKVPLISFPWTVFDSLLKVKRTNSNA